MKTKLERQLLHLLDAGPVRGSILKQKLGYHSTDLFHEHMRGIERKGLVVGFEADEMLNGGRVTLRWWRKVEGC